jgi:hypothetical protein
VAHRQTQVHAERVVVDVAQQRLAAVLSVVVVQAGVKADLVVQCPGVVQVVVILIPDVLELRGIQVDVRPGKPL